MRDPFFIVGNSRSGTTLAARILKKHEKIHVLNETHFYEEFSSSIDKFSELDAAQIYKMVNLMITIQRKDYYRKPEYEEYPEETNIILKKFENQNEKNFAALNKLFFEHETQKYKKERAGDQTPRHVFYVDEIFSMYPGAKVLHMVRDPRAVLYSQKKKWASGLRRRQPLFEVARTFLNYHPVTMSFLWCKAVNAGLNAEIRYGDEKVATLIFEDMVARPEFHLQRVCEFLGETFHQNMLDVTVELSANSFQEGQKGISKAVSRQWKKGLSSAEVFICEKITGKLMKKLGFPLSEKSPNWFLIGGYALWMPFHLGIAFLMNIGRMGNPAKYISKRLFQNN